jgi:hypothetical protein
MPEPVRRANPEHGPKLRHFVAHKRLTAGFNRPTGQLDRMDPHLNT